MGREGGRLDLQPVAATSQRRVMAAQATAADAGRVSSLRCPEALIGLQRSAGNREVARWLGRPAAAVVRSTVDDRRSTDGSAACIGPVVQREWVGGADAALYQNNVDNEISMCLPRYMKIAVLSRSADGHRRVQVKVGKEFNPREKANYSTFELRYLGTEGWMAAGDVTGTFPSADDFPIPDGAHTVPPLYHGSDRESVETIRKVGFQVQPAPSVGRSYGDGIYATPYVTKAAVHGFGKVAGSKGSPRFAVGGVSPILRLRSKPPRILVHNQLEEGVLASKLPPGGSLAERTKAVVEQLHGSALAKTAAQLAQPKPSEQEGQSPQAVFITKAEITAAARVQGYDIVVYTGVPGDDVYILLHPGEWQIDRTALEDQVEPTNKVTGGLEDLDWFHRATDLDRAQAALNRT